MKLLSSSSDDQKNGPTNKVRWGLLLTVVALVSMSGMLLEIALTRVLAALFFYHYAFATLSIAVLGIGIGAAVAHQAIHRRGSPPAPGEALVWLQRLALLAGGAVLGLALLVVATVTIDGRLWLALAAAIPYGLIGAALALLFAAWPDQSPTLYWADLGGAGLGAGAAIPLLNRLGGLDALLLAAGSLALGSIIFGCIFGCIFGHIFGRAFGRSTRTHALALLLLAGCGLGLGRLEVDVRRLATPKPLTRQLRQGQARVVYTHWDAFARTDVVELADADRPYKLLFINGAAGSLMPRSPAPDPGYFTNQIGYFPFRQTPERVFIIGPGGGRDLLFALLSGSQRVTAVEISPGVIEAVRRFTDYNGGLFDRPGVRVVVGEGRSYLQRQGGAFDLIFLSEVVALTAERGSYVLAENYVYTVEAFQDYLAHLAPGGRLALKLYDELTLTRAFTTAIAALEAGGRSQAQATRHIVALLDPRLVSRQAPLREPLLMLYRDPLTPERAAQLLAEIQGAGFIPLFVPYVQERPPLAALADGQASLDDMIEDFARADVSPTTDNRPFFYEFRHGLPDLLRQLLAGLGAVTLVALGYLWWHSRAMENVVDGGPFWPLILYFALLGAGFMLVEIAVIQRLTLFLGHPTTALGVGLVAILISGGLGSLAGGRLGATRPRRVVVGAAIFAGILALVYGSWLPTLVEHLLTWSLTARAVASVALILPLFFALGIPFPLGLRTARRQSGTTIVPLAWAVNGLASVLGSVGTIALAILWGFDSALVGGGLIYGFVALLAWIFFR